MELVDLTVLASGMCAEQGLAMLMILKGLTRLRRPVHCLLQQKSRTDSGTAISQGRRCPLDLNHCANGSGRCLLRWERRYSDATLAVGVEGLELDRLGFVVTA